MRSTFLFVNGGLFEPKRNNSTQGYFTGSAMCKLKEFSPTSRDHIAWAFETFRGWTAKERTTSGRAKIDDAVLREIGTDEALKFARILELQKHLGQLSDGKNAWLKLVTKGKIHHSCMLNTNTGRQVHMRPNIAQVPSAHEYRELFIPGKDRVQVGADASGLELRCLGHYLAPFDGGKFAKEVVEGDIHTALAEIYGTDRKAGKSVTYALIYGAGDFKLGTTAGASKKEATAKGKEIKARILESLDGFAELSKAIQKRAESDVLNGLDGRPIRLQGKKHAALNYILQSAGAVVCKLWLIRSNELLQEAGIDYWPLAFVHDEIQLSVSPAHSEQAALLTTYAMKDVHHAIKFRCALDSEYQIGNTWADCH
jgi:DNA polymerase I-like protein with 3'-5' exonuclease and polymerase domains